MTDTGDRRVLAQFKSEDGVLVGTPFDLPLDVARDSLTALCNAVLENVSVVIPVRKLGTGPYSTCVRCATSGRVVI